MINKKVIRLTELFDTYPVFYQPYIPPVINKLSKFPDLDVSVVVFNGKKSEGINVLPSYYIRFFLEKALKLFTGNNKKLSFVEMKFLQNKTDIIHIQHSYLFPKILGLLNLKDNKRPKIVITLRGGDTYVKPWINEKWSDFYKNYGNKVDAFVVMSDHQNQYLQAKWKVDKHRIFTIPVSFGENFKTNIKSPNQKVIKIISIFRMCWEKNISGNLMVIKNLIDRGLPVQYNIYGDGPDAGQVWYLIDKYRLGTNVFYHGKLKNEILKNRLKDSDFLLQLSFSESFGSTVIEAQSEGIPAIVSDAGGLPEAIINGKSGYCIAPYDFINAADHIENLWKKPDLYEAFSKSAMENAQLNFSIDSEIEKLMKLYKRIL